MPGYTGNAPTSDSGAEGGDHSHRGKVVVLAGGTGGAKLARGMLDVVGHGQLVVVANTGDDIEIYGGYVSPDPDLVTFWLADLIDERGWGLAGDTFNVMEGLRAQGAPVWFKLGDRDLAIALQRARALSAGARLTDAQAAIARGLGVATAVLPMSDQPVRTRIRARGAWWSFQEFMIKQRARGPVDDVDYAGAANAPVTAEVCESISSARAIVIGPSNPVISIGPMLALAPLRRALTEASASVVAVSPIVAGSILKGPTAAFMRWAGLPLDSGGLAAFYGPLLDGLVADEPTGRVATLHVDVRLDTPDARRRLAEQTLRFARDLG